MASENINEQVKNFDALVITLLELLGAHGLRWMCLSGKQLVLPEWLCYSLHLGQNQITPIYPTCITRILLYTQVR